MGLGDFLKKAVNVAVPALGTVFGGPVGGAIASGATALLNSAGSAAVDLGGQYVANKLITQPNAQQAFNNSENASAVAYERNKTMALDAYKRSLHAYKTRYVNTANDMKAAGLNPILAASGGFSVGNAPVMASPTSMPATAFQANQPSFQPSTSTKQFAEALKTDEETKRTVAETKRIANDSMLILEQIAKTKGEQSQIAQNVKNLMIQYDKLVQETISAQVTASRDYAKWNTYSKKIHYEANKMIEKLYEGKHLMHDGKKILIKYFNNMRKLIFNKLNQGE